MDWLGPIVRHAIAPLWARWERSPYLRDYCTLKLTQYDPPSVVRDHQWQAVAELVRHAYATSPFWSRRLDEAGVRPERLRGFDDFRAIPVLTKHDLRTHADALRSSCFWGQPLHHKKTSGSTGIAVAVHVDEAAQQWKRACTLRCDEWSGWRLGQPVARLWGNPHTGPQGWRRRLRGALLERTHYLDTLRMTEASMAEFARDLRRRPPPLLFGHAHSLYLFAEFLRARGGAGFRPRGIIATAMVLHPRERRAIEAVFGRPVTNRYGCEEVSLIACECERHDGLHVNAEGVYVEVLRPDGTPTRPGEAGAVVVTDLVNRAMPILRYEVGDMAVASDRRCPCGRGLPLLERLEGRVADYVVTPAGEMVSGISLTDHFGTVVPGIAQLQIVQEALDHLLFRIVRDDRFGPASLDHLQALVLERFGPEMDYDCEYVERIPQEPSGKYRFCISKVQNPFTRQLEAVSP
jgi:phenylacetate-CoA ligase